MDKAYTMMYELDKTGRIALGSSFNRYNSVRTLEASLDLQTGDEALVIKKGEKDSIIEEIQKEAITSNGDYQEFLSFIKKHSLKEETDIEEIVYNALTLYFSLTEKDRLDGSALYPISTLLSDPTFEQELQIRTASLTNNLELIRWGTYESIGDLSIDLLKAFNGTEDLLFLAYKDLNIVLRSLDKQSKTSIPLECKEEDFDYWLVRNLNLHNTKDVSLAALKNKIMRCIYKCASDVNNLDESTLPMDSKKMNALLREIESEKENFLKPVYSMLNPGTKAEIQYTNSVGKEDVGIAANGVKGDSSLQLFCNDWYKNINKISETAEKLELINMPLSIHIKDRDIITNQIKDRDIITKTFKRIGDTVVTDSLFFKLYENVPLEELKKETDYVAIKDFVLNQGQFSKPTDGATSNLFYYNDKGTLRLRSQYQDLWADLLLYSNKHKVSALDIINNAEAGNPREYIRFLRFKEQFNNNIADNLSVFISLATDNAKELFLARINASPELMGLPIAMISLGIDPKSTLDICVNLVDKIDAKLKVNKLQKLPEEYTSNIRYIIEHEKSYDSATKSSLLKIYDFAQELRTITSFFKINLGVTALFIDLLEFNKRLASSIKTLEKARGKLPEVKKILEVDSKFDYIKDKVLDLNLLFDPIETKPDGTKVERTAKFVYKDAMNVQLEKIVTAEQYKQDVLEYTDILKTGVNPLRVITGNKNFNSMLSVMLRQLNIIRRISGKAAFVDNQSSVSEGLDNDEVANRNRKLIQIYDHFIIGKTLDKLSNFQFKKCDIISSIGKSIPELEWMAGNTTFNLSSNTGLAAFVKVVEDGILPILKKKYSGNFFLRGLTDVPDRQTNITTVQLLYDTYNTEDIAEQSNINECAIALKRIAGFKSGLVNLEGKDISIGDMLYVYNMIANKNKMSSFTKCIEQAVKYTKSDIGKLLNDTYVEYDKKVFNGDPEVFREFEQTKLILKAIFNDDLRAEDDTQKLDLNGAYIWTKVPIVYSKQSIKDFLDSTNLPYSQKGSDITLEFLDGHTLTITVSSEAALEDLQISSQQKATVLNYINGLKTVKLVQSNWETFTPMKSDDFKSKVSKIFKNNKGLVDSLVDFENDLNTEVLVSRRLNTSEGITSLRNSFVYESNGKKIYVVSSEELDKTTTTTNFEMLDLLISGKLEEVTSKTKLDKLAELLGKNDKKETDHTKDKLYKEYASFLVNKYPEQDLIQSCLADQTITSQYLEHQNIFYREPVKGEAITYGDIVTFKDDKSNYIYYGNKNAREVFLNLETGLPRVNISDAKYTVKSKLKVTPFYLIPGIPEKLKYSDTVTKDSILSLNFGDKFRLYNIDFVFVDYLLNGKQQEVIAYDQNRELVNLKDIYTDSGNGILVNVQRVLNKAANTNIDLRQATTILFDKDFTELKNTYLPKVKYMDELIDLTGNSHKFHYKNSNGEYITDGGLTFSEDLIYGVKLFRHPNELNIDKLFEIDSKELGFYSLENKSFFSNYLFSIIGKNGYLLQKIGSKGKYVVVNPYRQNNLVYLLGGYSEVRHADLHKSDVFIARYLDHDDLYKVINFINNKALVYRITKDKSLNYDNLMNNQYKLETVSILDLAKYEHFTSNKEALNLELKHEAFTHQHTARELSNTEFNDALVNLLQEKFGMHVAEDKSILGARILNNTIFVRDVNDLHNESVHEFLHLIIANMRFRDPDSYIRIKNIVNGLVKEDVIKDSGIDAITYQGLDRTEELLVRLFSKGKEDSLLNIKEYSELQSFIANGFYSLFNISKTFRNSEEGKKRHLDDISLKWIIDTYSKADSPMFKDITESLNIFELRKAERLKKLIGDILEKCN